MSWYDRYIAEQALEDVVESELFMCGMQPVSEESPCHGIRNAENLGFNLKTPGFPGLSWNLGFPGSKTQTPTFFVLGTGRTVRLAHWPTGASAPAAKSTINHLVI